jgi:hypothetical protein
MKYFVLFFFFYSFSYTQIVRSFVGGAGFRSTEFENSRYYNFGIGLEFKVSNFIKPEIEAGYTLGVLQSDSKYNDNFNVISISNTKFYAFNLSFTPKIALFSVKEDRINFFVYPKYTFSIVTASNDFISINDNGQIEGGIQSENIQENLHSLGFGMGVYFNFPKSQTQTVAINLYFNNIDFASSINKLKNHGKEIYTRDVLGLGINYYFNL